MFHGLKPPNGPRNGGRTAQPRAVLTALAAAITVAAAATASPAAEVPQAQRDAAAEVLKSAGLHGGMIVHVGCGDGKLTAALRASEAYLVHGLDTDAENVRKAREYLQSLGCYGPVAVDRFDGKRLPYVDNLVNAVVAEDLGDVPMKEVLRVLCPEGVACIKQDGQWKTTVKPRPESIDAWTHYLYDATGNAVSQDDVVGPPRHFQWTGSPRWSRHHDRRASVSAMVCSGDRLFYIIDEGSTASIMLPSKTVLVARDAFNGTILWKRPIPTWHTRLWPFKSGPTQLQRRLVAVGDKVYVTLGLDAPTVELCAATGKTLRTYDGTFATEEILLSDGVLFLLVTPTPQSYDDFRPEDVGIGTERDRVMRDWPWDEKPRQIMAVEAASGKVLWKKEHRVVPLTLAADGRRAYFHDGECLAAVDRRTGEAAWRSKPVERMPSVPTNIVPTLVVHDDVVLFYGVTRKLFGVSAEDGEILWSGPHPKSGHYCPEDVLVAGGLVWGGAIAGGRDSGVFVGRDPQTGEVKSEFPPDIDIFFMHQRCYRSKATDKYLIPSWTGTEYIDFRNKHWETHHWVRSGCIYGIIPCNGLTYTTPHDCACYMQAKLYGFCALAPESKSRAVPKDAPAASRLETGPAYNNLPSPARGRGAGGEGAQAPGDLPSPARGRGAGGEGASKDWPTFRADVGRSGRAKTAVPADLKESWQADLGGKLSTVVVADGRLYVAAIDRHTVHALDAASGEELWGYTTGGRVDSPPTVWKGHVLFGSADGWIYCLRASDGELAWRFRAGPEDRRMTSFEQVESVWPVHGSVLVDDGVVYCVAGRSMFVDGGLRYLRLDAATGKLIEEVIFDERDPETGENLQVHVKVRNMPVGLPDVLSTDGELLFMRSQQFDREGKRRFLAPHSGKDPEQGAVQKGPGVHLFSPTGFLDDTWWHRSYWVYGRSFAEGAGGWPQAGKYAPAGRIMTVGDSKVYGFGRKPVYYKWRTPLEYHLFAAPRDPEIVRTPVGPQPEAKAKTKPAAQGKARPKAKRRGPPRVVHPQYAWSRSLPMMVRAMILADGTLLVAGPPDLVDEEEAFRRVGDAETEKRLAAQDAALRGEKGALLWVVSASDGEKLKEYRLDCMPVFDGMAAAAGRLYMATTNGKVLCFAGE